MHLVSFVAFAAWVCTFNSSMNLFLVVSCRHWGPLVGGRCRMQIASFDPRSTWVCLKAFRGFNPSGKCPSTIKRNRWNRTGYTVNQGPFFPLGIDRNGWEVSYPNLPVLAPDLFFRQLFKVAMALLPLGPWKTGVVP